MALLACNECENQVSNRAIACPKCGNPIAGAKEVKATGAHITTTQATAKKFKAHQILGFVVLLIGLVVFFATLERSPLLGASIMVVGLIWGITARMLAWWHHG